MNNSNQILDVTIACNNSLDLALLKFQLYTLHGKI